MFNLEQSIAEWRERMLAAGIKAHALDELENHLREEMERQRQSGLDEAAAFGEGVRNIGKPDALKNEFKKIGGRTLTTDRILGLLWFIYCAGSFFTLTRGLFNSSDLRTNALFFLALLMDMIYLRGLFASVLLFGGHTRERRFIFFLAALDAIGGVVVLSTRAFHFLPCAFTIVGFLTLIAYWPRPKLKSVIE